MYLAVYEVNTMRLLHFWMVVNLSEYWGTSFEILPLVPASQVEEPVSPPSSLAQEASDLDGTVDRTNDKRSVGQCKTLIAFLVTK